MPGDPGTDGLDVSHTPGHIQRSLEAGALGYVLKDDISRELIPAIRTLHENAAYFSKQVAEIAKHYLYAATGVQADPETTVTIETLKRLRNSVHVFLFASIIFAEMFMGS